MILDDKVLGKPLRLYVDTDANINLITTSDAGSTAYTTDTHKLLIYNGSDWVEVTGTGGGTWASNETPSGAINGINDTFTLAHTPVSWIQLYLNGIILEPGLGNDYTLASDTITMLFAPATGDKLRAYYMY